MKLLAYKIDLDGTLVPVNEYPTGITPEMLNGNEKYKIIQENETVTSGYADISSIENWAEYGIILITKVYCFMDLLVLKSILKSLAIGKASNGINQDWDLLVGSEPLFSVSEKKTLIYYLNNEISEVNITKVYPVDSHRTQQTLAYISYTSTALKQRYAIIRAYFQKKVGLKNATDFFMDASISKFDIKKGNYVFMYLGGIERKATSGQLALADFIEGTETEHNSTAESKLKGLIHRTYQVVDGSSETLSDVRDYIVGIIDNGIY